MKLNPLSYGLFFRQLSYIPCTFEIVTCGGNWISIIAPLATLPVGSRVKLYLTGNRPFVRFSALTRKLSM